MEKEIEPKKSAFRVRTKMGSSQGMRQSQIGLENNSALITRPITKLPDNRPQRLDSSRVMNKDQPAEPQEEEGKQQKGEGWELNLLQDKSTPLKGKHTAKMGKVLEFPGKEVFSVRFNTDDSLVAIELRGLGQVRHNSHFKTNGDEMPISAIRWKDNSRILASNVDGWLVDYDVETASQVGSVQEKDNQILGMDYNQPSLKIVTVGKDSTVRIYDDPSKRVIRAYEKGSWVSPGHSNRVFGAKFLANNPNIIVTGGWDSSVFIWDIRESKSQGAFVGPNISGEALDVKGDVILAGSHRAKESVQLYDLGTRKLIGNVDVDPGSSGDNAYCFAAQFAKSGEDTFAAGFGVRNELRVFDKQTGYIPAWNIRALPRAVYSIDWAHKGRKIIFGCGDGRVFLVRTDRNTDY